MGRFDTTSAFAPSLRGLCRCLSSSPPGQAYGAQSVLGTEATEGLGRWAGPLPPAAPGFGATHTPLHLGA